MLGGSCWTGIPLTKIPASTAVQLQMESKIVVGCWFSCRGPQFLKATASGKPRVKAVTATDHTRTLPGPLPS